MSPETNDEQQRLSGRLRRAAQAWPADAPLGLGERMAARVAVAVAAPMGRRPLTMPAWAWLTAAAGLLIAIGALASARGAPSTVAVPVVALQPLAHAADDDFTLPTMPSEIPLNRELRNLDADMRATAAFLVDRLPVIELAQREPGPKTQP